ncbi:MAG: formylglycine-generating enzyme family protein [Planctomycetaceae bacterium]|jgi:formylglycine-generating enzyme required for sulfatase activity|nr:formylglycine-generating enzyme family protein [Planctomycetaceae bacterium]
MTTCQHIISVRLFSLVMLTAAFAATAAPFAEAREWKLESGKTTTGEFIEVIDDGGVQKVRLKKEDGQITRIKLTSLSEEDRKYVTKKAGRAISTNQNAAVRRVGAEASKAGATLELTIKDVKFRFRYCPAGTFTMGSPAGETGRYGNEKQHQVTLSQGFWMLETEVTQEHWESIMGENPSRFTGEKLPVEKVSWNDCQDFVKKLNALGTAPKGYKFSLPTESQWEYACRAGTTGAYAGDLDQMAWYGSFDGIGRDIATVGKGNSGNKTHEVGTKQANAWGLYDMHGNVFEWCNDWYGDYPTGNVADPVGASSGSYRVFRGGCWYYAALFCRSAIRSISTPDCTFNSLGVRVSLVSGQ